MCNHWKTFYVKPSPSTLCQVSSKQQTLDFLSEHSEEPKWAFLKLKFYFKFHFLSFKIGITFAFCSGLSILLVPPGSLATLFLFALGFPSQPLWMALIGCPCPLAYGWIRPKGNDMSECRGIERSGYLFTWLSACWATSSVPPCYQISQLQLGVLSYSCRLSQAPSGPGVLFISYLDLDDT